MSNEPASKASQTPDFPRSRRFIFVQLLFSLTAAELARGFATLVYNNPPWPGSISAYSHLLLAGMVVTTSWVGWSVSKASLHPQLGVNSVFGWPFWILFTDVMLVVLYFILVRGAEIPEKRGDAVVPSAKIEVDMIALIFVGYFIWDFLTKAVVRLDGEPPTFLGRLTGPMLKRGWMSLVCMVLAGLAWICLTSRSSLRGVLLADVALLALVFLFRALKEHFWKLSLVLLAAFAICFVISGL